MTIEIKKTDIQGEPENICTQYDVHTISLVDKCALGVNIVKAKKKDESESEEITALKDKIEKAKSLDAEEAAVEQEAKAKAEVEESEAVEDHMKHDVQSNGEGETPSKNETEEVSEGDSEVEEATDPVEKSKSEEEGTEEEGTEETTEERKETEGDSEGDSEEASEDPVEGEKTEETEESEDSQEVDTEVAEEQTEKAKMFTADEVGDVNKLALDAMSKVFKEIMSKYPDADQWEVFNLLQDALYVIDWAIWDEKEAQWDEVWSEVWNEVNSRVEKSKSLKALQSDDPIEVAKALEATNPEAAALLLKQGEEIQLQKAKALEAEEETKRVEREKAIEKAKAKYSRIATEDNTIESIVDALATVETEAPQAHEAISKALNTAATAINGGALFGDIGSDEHAEEPMTEGAYVESKAKSLVDSGQRDNLAAARADVRQSAEFIQLYKS